MLKKSIKFLQNSTEYERKFLKTKGNLKKNIFEKLKSNWKTFRNFKKSMSWFCNALSNFRE